MALGDYCIETIITKSGDRLRVGTEAVEPVSDIALLGALDDQAFSRDCTRFEKWSEETEAVPVANTIPRWRETRLAHILTHKGQWTGARIVNYSEGPPRCGRLCIEAEDRIEGGTSGGPVVDSSGRLIGVVSWSNDVAAGEKCTGMLPTPHLALPQWAWRLIRAAEQKGE